MSALASALRPAACGQAFQRTSNTALHAAAPGASQPSVSTPPTCPATAPRPHATASPATLDRREMLILSSSLVVSHLAALGVVVPPPARAAQGLSRYVRRKQLDPLETYVPLVLEARTLLPRAKELALTDVGAARELLRQGPYSGLRDNVRAIGEYAARDGRSDGVGPLVTGFFRSLEAYDQLLYGALREKKTVAQEDVAARVADVDAAFGALLATVPPDVLERAQRVLAVAAAKAEAAAAEGAAAVEGVEAAAVAAPAAADEDDVDLVRLLR